jgi:UDP-N-acetylglucosamine--N-acetylmuramyl-(pentapeptide) pyrophosphoryl-undecaprenol N-acetylglucosamine transferase
MSNKVLIMAAGTGGHIFPALAIARELSSRGMDVEWLGSKGGMEEKIVPKHGHPIHCIHSSGLRGKSLFAFIKGVCLLAIGFIQTISLFLKNKPNIVIGMGGYASGIGGIVAKIFFTRLVIHEQNAIPGTTNRLLSRIANKSFQAFDNSFDSKVKAVTVGNPILFQAKTKNCPKSVNNLLVLGGSLGAKKINELIPLIKTPLNIWHQTGDSHIETTKLAYQDSLHLNVHIESFIENIAEAYEWADLVICRAGAMTISELIATKSIAILIPFPYAVDDHQTQNAKKLSDVGAGLLLDESNLDVNEIDDILQKMTPAKLELMTNILEKLQTENAEKVITDYLLIPSRSNSN